MKHLENTTYKKFVEQHILRPYQNDIIDAKKPVNFTAATYRILPDYFNKNPAWCERVFSRIAKIYDTVDADVFPVGITRMIILMKLHDKGVKIVFT